MKLFLAYALFAGSFFGTNTELSVKSDAVKIKFVEGKDTEGTIGGFKAHIHFDANDIAHSSISGTVDVSTLETGTPKRDEHLKSSDYFDAAKYPAMSFSSKSIQAETDGFSMIGMMKIKDVELEEKITFTYQDKIFSGSTTIYLANYKVGPYAKKKPEQTPVKISFEIPVN